jgi:tetratricopeptide (TPR) repeat protein/predicted Ser/Thr protein kinase
MSPTHEHLEPLSPDQRQRLDSIVAAFEDSWRPEAPLTLGDALPTEGPLRFAALVELVHADLEFRVKEGLPARAADYLGRFPELAEARGVIVDLFAREYDLRRRKDPAPTPGDFVRTVPEEYREEVLCRLPAAAPRVTGPQVPGYEVLRELGHGGMGVVYEARQLFPPRTVALKMLRADAVGGDEGQERFRREVEAVARLQHPNIVQLYEYAEHDGRPSFAMEFVDGGSLDRQLKDRPLPPDQAARLVATLARAVHHAHQQGVVHRDLKPANVLVAADGTPKIADFGLARRLDQPLLSVSGAAIIGTPAYMAPEQATAQARAIGPTTDVYGLGAILYETLTCRPPFQGVTALDVLQQVVAQEPTPPRQLNSAVPRDLETVCLKCLRKETHGRYSSALALAEDVERYLRGEPVWARPVGPVGRLARWCRRRPVTAGLLIALVGVFLIGSGGVFWQWRRAEAGRRESDESLRAAVRAVDDALNEVSESELLDLPNTQPLRRRLLQTALPYYQSFVRQRGQDPALRVELAQAHQRMAAILVETGARAEARAEFEQARDLFEQVLRGDPGNPEARRQLAVTYRSLGSLLQTAGDTNGALTSLGLARQLQEPLLTEDPGNAERRGDLARTYEALGLLNRMLGRQGDAVALLKEAVRLWDEVVGQVPASTAARSALAAGCHHLALQLSEMDAPGDAIAAYRRAVALQQQLLRENPTAPRFRGDLAGTLVSLGRLLEPQGDTDGARQAYEEARDHGKWLVEFNPSVPQYQADLATAYHYLGMLHRAKKQPREAREALEEAVKIRRRLAGQPGAAPYRKDLAASLMGLALLLAEDGQRDQAMTVFEEAARDLDDLSRRSPEMLPFRRDFVASTVGIAGMQFLAGKHAGALASFRRAATALEQLVQDFPDVPRFRSDLGTDYRMIALTEEETGAPDRGIGSYRKARRLEEELVRQDPNNLTYRVNLAATLNPLGLALAKQGRKEEALAVHQEGVEVLRPAYDRDQRVAVYREYLSYHYFNVAELRRDFGRPEEAFAAARERRRLWDGNGAELNRSAWEFALCIPLVGKDGAELTPEQQAQRRRYADEAAASLRGAFDAGFRDLPRMAGDRAWEPLRDHPGYRQLLARLVGAWRPTVAAEEERFRKDPDSVTVRVSLARALDTLGWAVGELGQLQEALDLHRRGIAVLRPAYARQPEAKDCRRYLSYHYWKLAGVQRRLGSPEEAFATALERRQLWPGNADHWVYSARELALCIPLAGPHRARRYADEALASLRGAIDAGFRDVERLEKEPDLRALRSYPEYAALVEPLKAGKKGP